MARVILPLNDPKIWSFRQADNAASQWRQVSRMPTNVHIDLLHYGHIAHPFIGKNEEDCQWVGESAWAYKARFKSPDLAFGDKAVLAFDGLDTYATVVLNGIKILQTKNMFIPERVNVTVDLLLGQENTLEIRFDSTYLIGKKLVEQRPDHRWGCWNGDPSRLVVRKAQYHYGWDWGPTLLTSGPWRPISIEVYTSRITDLYFTTDVEKLLRSAEVVAKADIEGDGDEVRFTISIDGEVVGAEIVTIEERSATATFKNHRPKLWYPHTYGEQPLYMLEATLLKSKVVLDKASKRFGLRRAEVVQRKLDGAVGSTFFFQINNIPVFCGGSNWIPGEILDTRMSPERYREWITAIVEGNQIMLRAWGGGIYEDSAFYDACDEMGLLIWQDFLFACGNYPANEDFLALVKREATENVKLLRHHPCIVIFAGNNEDYAYRETEKLEYNPGDPNPTSWLNTDFPARYIYELILADVMKDLVPNTYYHFGSPFSGTDSTDPHVGDIHQWNVWHGRQERYQDFDKLVGRFVSEFGMEAFPCIETVDSYLPQGRLDVDRYPQSSTVDFHNKAAGQEGKLALYQAENIRITMEPFEQYIYCTQLMQSECVSNAYKLWKRQWKGPRREYCSGALVWQANDCWPCTSWSIIDYYLRPKMAYFAIKRELKQITIGLKRTIERIPEDKYTRAHFRTIHKIEMWVCNLSLETREGVRVRVQGYNPITREQTSWGHLEMEVQLLHNRSTEIAEFEIPVVGHAISTVIASPHGTGPSVEEQQQQTVIAAYLYNADGEQIARAVNWPEPLKHVHIPKPTDIKLELTASPSKSTADGFTSEAGMKQQHEAVTALVSADVPVKGLVLEVVDPKGGHSAVKFEDNGVDLMPGESVCIGVRGLECGDEGRLRFRYLGM